MVVSPAAISRSSFVRSLARSSDRRRSCTSLWTVREIRGWFNGGHNAAPRSKRSGISWSRKLPETPVTLRQLERETGKPVLAKP